MLGAEFEKQACPALAEVRQMAKGKETELREVKKTLRATKYGIIELENLQPME